MNNEFWILFTIVLFSCSCEGVKTGIYGLSLNVSLIYVDPASGTVTPFVPSYSNEMQVFFYFVNFRLNNFLLLTNKMIYYTLLAPTPRIQTMPKAFQVEILCAYVAGLSMETGLLQITIPLPFFAGVFLAFAYFYRDLQVLDRVQQSTTKKDNFQCWVILETLFTPLRSKSTRIRNYLFDISGYAIREI